jgi:CheY-like chemotaxis protein
MTQPQVRILVVDDERNIRNNLTIVLESAGYKVDASGNGEDALTNAKSGTMTSRSSTYRCPRWEASNCSATCGR